VDIAPEDAEEGKEPYLVPPEFQDIKKNNDKKEGKQIRPHQQFPECEDHGITDEYGQPDEPSGLVFVPMDKEKTDEEDGQEIEEASQDDEAVIPRKLEDLVNDGLKEPVIVIPGFGRRNVREEGISGDGSILPEMPPAGEVIPQVGIVSHHGPGDEIADKNEEKKGN